MSEQQPVQQQSDERSQQNMGGRRRTIRQRLDIRPRRTGRTVVIPKKDVEKLALKVEELSNVVTHSYAPSGTLFVEFEDVKNSGEFFSKINAQCKKDGLGRHTVKTSLYSIDNGFLYILINYFMYRVNLKGSACSICSDNPFPFAV